MVVLFGQRGKGKTFVVLGWSFAHATGGAWHGHAAKPGPVGWCDRRFKAARGWMQGLGILVDDLVAALCTLLVISIAHFILQ